MIHITDVVITTVVVLVLVVVVVVVVGVVTVVLALTKLLIIYTTNAHPRDTNANIKYQQQHQMLPRSFWLRISVYYQFQIILQSTLNAIHCY